MQLKDAVEDYLLDVRTHRVSDQTMKLYSAFLREFSTFIGEVEIKKLGAAHIRKFIGHCQDRKSRTGKELSGESVHKYYSVIRTFCIWLYDQRIIREKITDLTKAPQKDNNLPDAMTDAEVTKLFDYLEDMGIFRNKVIFEFFLDTGCRLEEVSKIDIDSVNIDQGYVKVKGKWGKEGIVPIGKKLTRDLHAYMVRYRHPKDEKEKALFLNRSGERLDRDGMSMLVRRILSKIRTDGKKGAHTLRHTMATNFLRNGGNLEALRRILRHSDIKVTQRYTNLLVQDVLDSHREASPLDRLGRE